MIDFVTVERWVSRARAAQAVADVVGGVATVVDAPGTLLLLYRDAAGSYTAGREAFARGEADWQAQHHPDDFYDDLGLFDEWETFRGEEPPTVMSLDPSDWTEVP